MLTRADLGVLADPVSGGPLRYEGTERDGGLYNGVLKCDESRSSWAVEDGLARLYRPAQVTGTDAMMRLVYDGFAAFHDAGVRYGLPLYGGGTERQIREGYMPELRLGELTERGEGEPLRILEVSIGTGANLGLVLRDLPAGLPVELWGIDLSTGMLARCEQRLRKKRWTSPDGSHVRTMLADAHALPFRDGMFDRVFHVGGIAGFRDPGRAMAEMARVARADTPIVVVDEALDPDRKNNAWHRGWFKALTAFDPDVHVPREHVPFEAEVLCDKQVSRFYYCLSFKMPAR